MIKNVLMHFKCHNDLNHFLLFIIIAIIIFFFPWTFIGKLILVVIIYKEIVRKFFHCEKN